MVFLSILDLILVAQQLGKRVPAGSPVDVNGDGVVSILDLIWHRAMPSHPLRLQLGQAVDAAMIEAWIAHTVGR